MAGRSPRTAKIAISLPRALYRVLEKIRQETGETRSALVQRLIAERLAHEEHEERIRQYEQGYRERPETAGEVAAAEAAAKLLLADETWE